MAKTIWAGWDLKGKVLTIWFFDKQSGKLQWIGTFTFDGEISEEQAYLEAMRFQMIENEELPAKCVTMDLKDVVRLMKERITFLAPSNVLLPVCPDCQQPVDDHGFCGCPH